LASSSPRTGAPFFVFLDGMAGGWRRGAGSSLGQDTEERRLRAASPGPGVAARGRGTEGRERRALARGLLAKRRVCSLKGLGHIWDRPVSKLLRCRKLRLCNHPCCIAVWCRGSCRFVAESRKRASSVAAIEVKRSTATAVVCAICSPSRIVRRK
jgi:hypothetical protein